MKTGFLGYDLNEHGVMISRHRCPVCRQTYTLTPATPDDAACNRPPGTDGPGDAGCVSYDPARDVGRLLAGGGVLAGTPTAGRGEA